MQSFGLSKPRRSGLNFPLKGQKVQAVPPYPSGLLALGLEPPYVASYLSVSRTVVVLSLDICLGKQTPQPGLKNCTLLLQAAFAPHSFAYSGFESSCPAELGESPSAKP